MKAVTHVIALALKSLAVAIPFLFAYTQSPLTNFWPLVASALCGGLIVLLSIARMGQPAALREDLGRSLAFGLLLAGTLASVVGLIQFFKGDVGLSPWIYQSTVGQAIGNVRQRNQQATLLLMAALALLLCVSRWLGGARERGVDAPTRANTWVTVFAVAAPWLLALLCMGSGVTASRTGAVEWMALVIMLWFWRKSMGRLALGLAVAGLFAYLLAAWALPELLLRWTGVQVDGLFMRVADTSHRCTSRFTLWSNMAHLIGLQPWTGWGWGELDFAHYSTVFPGERFCVLLDNAHNLPLHLAVELGLPVAMAFCALVLWVLWRAKPWRETDAARQLAWGVLALIAMHSMLEFPLWYGPFQLVAVLSIVILLLPVRAVEIAAQETMRWQVAALLACVAWLAGIHLVTSDFRRMAALYQSPPYRAAQWRELTPREVSENSDFFTDQAEFAWLTTTSLTPGNAAQMHAMARRMLHYSPEPRVITKLIESARILGVEVEVQEQMKLFQIAYPDAFKAFVAKQPLPAASAH
ncbi:PglL family O-oligosaccharyltransferase [Diaphorobacter aerolatus]|uniref:O-antigen ligase C-terminal domain-containing protein n=1 Tax=Diaphorobacter aerolatus TaxID=1288495 RepID=A0A7H0GHH8_9BURK|nr:Wzy polymerase domain-containing protein [Diaphorobacter aerolatus]QNP47744.1 O-antigen ligase C-terminal domain-containing protein [Diaphorobacter aerolatus]